MHPILFNIGPVTIYTYGVVIAVAFLVSTFLVSQAFKRKGLSSESALDLAIYLLIFGVVGARLLHVFLNKDYYFSNIKEIFMLHHGGLAWQGGLIFAFLGGVYFIKKNSLKAGQICDLVIPYVALGHAIGRIGCFFNGCCYGKATSFFLGVFFPGMYEARHPTQVYTSFFLVMLFIILKKVEEKKSFSWQVFSLYLMLYAILRFAMDFLRGDLEIVFLDLTISQLIGITMFLIGLFLYVKRSLDERKKRISG